MNFQQLRSLREATRRGYNLTEVAAMMHTSQPGVSRQIRELEDELGVEIFIRAGKRLTGLTPPGETLLPIVERLLLEADNLRRVGQDYADSAQGRLSIAATHSQARYALPHAVRDFRALFPDVTLHLHQGSPRQVADMLLSGEADIGVATEALSSHEALVTLSCYRWTHSIVLPHGHPLLALQAPVSLEQLAQYPIITYEQGYTGRSHIDQAFARAGLVAEIVLTAMDADVIKTYVELGLGVGIVASVAVNEERDRELALVPIDNLFEVNTTWIAVRRGHYLRGFAFRFIELCSADLTEETVRRSLNPDRSASMDAMP